MKTTKSLLVLLSAVLLAACDAVPPPDPSVRLHDLFDREWAFRLREDPLWATEVGHHERNDALPSVTEEDQKRRADFLRGLQGELAQIDRSRLDE